MANPWLTMSLWLQAIITLAVGTIYWKDNPFGKWGEHVWIGTLIGNLSVMGLKAIYEIGFNRIFNGAFIYIIAILMGLATLTRYSSRYRWLSRYPAALLVGIGTGISVRAVPEASITKQISALYTPLFVLDPITSINNILIFIITILGIFYFTFTVRPLAAGKIPEKLRIIARYVFMAAFGVTFATVVVTRFNQYAGRVMFLLFDWLGLG